MAQLNKLNLGCGKNLLLGHINVDKYGSPDVLHDLEKFPWPFHSNSAEEIVLNHVLEHLGETSDSFLGIVKELYRVAAPGAAIHIAVPHPRCDDFINDPTHIRAITPELMGLFSKKNNERWISEGAANSPLAIFLDVDMEIENLNFYLCEPWSTQLQSNQISEEELGNATMRYNNVVKEIRMTLRVIKHA